MKNTRFWLIMFVVIASLTFLISIPLWGLDMQHSDGGLEDCLGLSLVIYIILVVPIIVLEAEICHTIAYFVSDKQDRQGYKTVFHLAAAVLSAGTVLSIFILDYITTDVKVQEAIIFGFFCAYIITRIGVGLARAGKKSTSY